MKLLILGAGIAGGIAAGATSSYAPLVFESKPEQTSGLAEHKAVMRIRDPRVALLLGCNATKITVHKMALIHKSLVEVPSIEINNLYSLKVSGQVSEKSILQLGRHERYLLDGNFQVRNALYGHRLERILKGWALVRDPKGGLKEYEYDACISTLPMPVIGDVLEIPLSFPGPFNLKPIHVWRAKLTVPCSVHQTIYIPEPDYATYRATLEAGQLIFEATREIPEEETKNLMEHFGLSSVDVVEQEQTVQKNGKMIAIDDEARKRFIYDLTVQYNIYSFGRFAIWKPIRADHLVEDIDRIKKLMKVKDNHYSLNKERGI